MKSIDVYMYKINNRQTSRDSRDTSQFCPSQEVGSLPFFEPPTYFNINPEFIDDWLEREAILVIDGGVDPSTAGLRAKGEIVSRYGVICITNKVFKSEKN